MASIRAELNVAIDELHSRGLLTAERWVAEQLCGLEDSSTQHHATVRQSAVPDPGKAHPLYLLARSHFAFKVRSCRMISFFMLSIIPRLAMHAACCMNMPQPVLMALIV